jgi:flavin reductase (DIM6/NTAB) family NADH-FMN oxidoreductase RutF
MGINPPLVYISSNIKHYTNRGILENDTFSVSIPTTDLLALTDYCGVASASEADKSQLFDVFYGGLEMAPMIAEFPVYMECRVEREFTIEYGQIFVGRIAETYVDEEYILEREGGETRVDMTILDPVACALDNLYYRVGEPIGEGYQEAGALKKGGVRS